MIDSFEFNFFKYFWGWVVSSNQAVATLLRTPWLVIISKTYKIWQIHIFSFEQVSLPTVAFCIFKDKQSRILTIVILSVTSNEKT